MASFGDVGRSRGRGVVKKIRAAGRRLKTKKPTAVTFEGVMKRMADNFVSNELLQKVDKSMFPETAADSANNIALRDITRDFLTKRLDKILPPYFAQ